MEPARPLVLIASLFLALVVNQAVLPSSLYWNSVLPNTPMPKAIKDILRPNSQDYKNTPLKVAEGDGLNADYFRWNGRQCEPPGNRGASKTQLRYADPNTTILFLLNNMVPGNQMYFDFPKAQNDAPFVPRYVADSIPFSSKKFPEILNYLSVNPESNKATILKDAIRTCEEPGVEGEDKFCPTSLESMIDFSISNLGKQLKAMSTEVEKENEMKKYTFMPGIKKMADGKSVSCHKLNYPYAVFYCHAVPSTSVYMILLQASDGSTAKAVAVCHKDTSTWDPKNVAFAVLKVKPGTIPICHFLPQDSLVWGQN